MSTIVTSRDYEFKILYNFSGWSIKSMLHFAPYYFSTILDVPLYVKEKTKKEYKEAELF